MNDTNSTTDTILRLSPPLTVSSLTLLGIPMSQITLILTAIYTLLMIILTIRDKFFGSNKNKSLNKEEITIPEEDYSPLDSSEEIDEADSEN